MRAGLVLQYLLDIFMTLHADEVNEKHKSWSITCVTGFIIKYLCGDNETKRRDEKKRKELRQFGKEKEHEQEKNELEEKI